METTLPSEPVAGITAAGAVNEGAIDVGTGTTAAASRPTEEGTGPTLTMKNANPGDVVEFKGLKGAAQLNGTEGYLVKYVKRERRWAVKCKDGQVVKAKEGNLILLGPNPAIAEVLSNAEILSQAFSYLHWKGILHARVCRKWREAARLTNVPQSKTDDGWHTPELYVQNRDVAEALRWISDALPGMSTVNVDFGLRKTEEFEIADGIGPNQRLRLDSSLGVRLPKPVDISPIANFRHLQSLTINQASLNGSYPYLFNFPNLRSLELCDVGMLQWNLGMLSGLPKLERLRCIRNNRLTGTLEDLTVIRESLAELCLSGCSDIEGNLMNLADFPLLRELSMNGCDRIVGDIRDIRPGNFPSMEDMNSLPEAVYGVDIPFIQDAPAIMHAWYVLKKRNPRIFEQRRISLSLDSPDRYYADVHHSRDMPKCVEFVKAGQRLGWRWTNAVSGGSCEPVWLDPEPDPSGEGYDVYLKELKDVERDVEFFKGFTSPPTLDELLQRNAEVPLDPILQMYSNRRHGGFGGWW